MLSDELIFDSEYREALEGDAVAACRKLVNSCRGSGQRQEGLMGVIKDGNATKKFTIRLVKLVRDMEVRWSSTHVMIDRALELYPVSKFVSILDFGYLSCSRPSNSLLTVIGQKCKHTNYRKLSEQYCVMYAVGYITPTRFKSWYQRRKRQHSQLSSHSMKNCLPCSRRPQRPFQRSPMPSWSQLKRWRSISIFLANHEYMHLQ